MGMGSLTLIKRTGEPRKKNELYVSPVYKVSMTNFIFTPKDFTIDEPKKLEERAMFAERFYLK